MNAVTRYVLVVAAIALAACAAATAARPPGAVEPEAVSILVALTVALIVTGALPLRLAGDPPILATLEEAVLVAMLVTVPLGIVPWLVLLGTLLDAVRRRTPPIKATFNAAIAGLGAAGAVGVVIGLESVADGQILVVLAVAAFGAAVAGTLQLVGLAGLHHLLDNGSFRSHLSLAGFLDVALGLNLTLGLLLTTAILVDPWLAWLDVVAVAVLGLVLRDLTGEAAQRRAPSG